MARTQVFGVTAKPSSLSLEDIRNAQAADDSLQPVIQALMDGVRPPRKVYMTSQKRHYPLLPEGFTRPRRQRLVQALSLPRWYHPVPASRDTS